MSFSFVYAFYSTLVWVLLARCVMGTSVDYLLKNHNVHRNTIAFPFSWFGVQFIIFTFVPFFGVVLALTVYISDRTERGELDRDFLLQFFGAMFFVEGIFKLFYYPLMMRMVYR